MTKPRTNKKIQNLKNDFEEKIDLIHLSYDQIANGSRYSYPSKKINPDTKRILEKLFDIKKSDETISTINTESGTLISADEKEEFSKNLGRTQIDLSLMI